MRRGLGSEIGLLPIRQPTAVHQATGRSPRLRVPLRCVCLGLGSRRHGTAHMSLRDRVLGPCAWQVAESEEIVVDVDELLTRLLLFETYVLDSFALKELPKLVALFGYDGVIELLQADALKLHPYRLFAGHLIRNQPGLAAGRMLYSLTFDRAPPVRPGFYEITNVTVGKPSDELQANLQIAHQIPGLTNKQAIRLKREVARRAIEIPDNYGTPSTDLTHRELDTDTAALRRAVARIYRRQSARRWSRMPSIFVCTVRVGLRCSSSQISIASSASLPRLHMPS